MAEKAKIWKASLSAPAQFAITQNSAFIVGAENRFIKVNESGTTIYGPVSIVAGTESIKTGGMFTSLPNLIKMIPSTFVSPLPDQIPMPPINVAFDLAEDVAFFSMLLA
jgi:hypothetical protein